MKHFIEETHFLIHDLRYKQFVIIISWGLNWGPRGTMFFRPNWPRTLYY